MTIGVGELAIGVTSFSVMHGSKVVTKLMAKAVVTKGTSFHGDRESQSILVSVGVCNATSTKVCN